MLDRLGERRTEHLEPDLVEGSLAVPAVGIRPVVVVPDLAVPIHHTISRLFQISVARHLHTRIQMPVVALRRQGVVHKAVVVVVHTLVAVVHMLAEVAHTAVAVDHMSAVVDRTLVAADHTAAAAAAVRIVVAAVDCTATEEEVVHTELAEEADRTEIAEVVEAAEGDRKDSAQREIEVEEVRRNFAAGRERH